MNKPLVPKSVRPVLNKLSSAIPNGNPSPAAKPGSLVNPRKPVPSVEASSTPRTATGARNPGVEKTSAKVIPSSAGAKAGLATRTGSQKLLANPRSGARKEGPSGVIAASANRKPAQTSVRNAFPITNTSNKFSEPNGHADAQSAPGFHAGAAGTGIVKDGASVQDSAHSPEDGLIQLTERLNAVMSRMETAPQNVLSTRQTDPEVSSGVFVMTDAQSTHSDRQQYLPGAQDILASSSKKLEQVDFQKIDPETPSEMAELLERLAFLKLKSNSDERTIKNLNAEINQLQQHKAEVIFQKAHDQVQNHHLKLDADRERQKTQRERERAANFENMLNDRNVSHHEMLARCEKVRQEVRKQKSAGKIEDQEKEKWMAQRDEEISKLEAERDAAQASLARNKHLGSEIKNILMRNKGSNQ